MTKSIFFFLFLYSAFAISKPCLENTNLDAQAVKLFKFESTCQNSLKSCKEIFDASFTQNKIAEPHEAIDNYQCKKGEKLKNIETGIAIAFGFKYPSGLSRLILILKVLFSGLMTCPTKLKGASLVIPRALKFTLTGVFFLRMFA